jgi:hypothetical protein
MANKSSAFIFLLNNVVLIFRIQKQLKEILGD